MKASRLALLLDPLLVGRILRGWLRRRGLSIGKASVAISNGLSVHSGYLKGLVEAALRVEGVTELCTLEA
jgi:hypothetical protein